MRITYGFLCDYATVSKEGKVSIMGIFSNINASQIPFSHPQMYLAFELEMSYAELNKDFTMRIDGVDADGARVFGANAKFNIEGKGGPGQNPRVGQVLQMNNITFNREGGYEVNIFINEELKRQIPFTVTRAQPPPQAQIEGQPPPQA